MYSPGDDVVYAYGTAAKSNKVKAHLMFALDKDNTTCFDLPIKVLICVKPILQYAHFIIFSGSKV